ncbi:MAG: putative metal-binding protein [Elusimicrobia bacterium]|nr:MAG: putative metal-binding protein [Elusimicrobiota bacterium]KAF0156106.1 MAG: putative metal-binding protein [Elusimicrobiota bacterium]
MIWNFIKDKLSREKPAEPKKEAAPAAPAKPVPPSAEKQAPSAAVKGEKPVKDKTDDELAAELDKISPEILSQARTPQMRQMIIGVYRKMLSEGVDINDGRAVKKWLKKHPEVLQGGEVQKVETVRREEPKVGRNDPCHCGSGRKYKKCCGAKG